MHAVERGPVLNRRENDKGLRERAGPAADTMNEAALLLRTYCTDAGPDAAGLGVVALQ